MYYFLFRFSQFSSQAKQGNGIVHSTLLQIEFKTHGANNFSNFAMFVIQSQQQKFAYEAILGSKKIKEFET